MRVLQEKAAPLRVLAVVGTRPEAIKMAPLFRTISSHPGFSLTVAVTGQHRELLDQVLRFFSIEADFDLSAMTENQTLSELTCRILPGVEGVITRVHPDVVLVHGDTTTAFVAALAAFYQGRPTAHVEAGLRTGDPLLPYPEEMNRRLVATLAALHFAPTPVARDHLLAEGVPESRIFVTGNTVIDAVRLAVTPGYPFGPVLKPVLSSGRRIVLVTVHRRENWGTPMRRILGALAKLAERITDAEFVFPVHPNPRIRAAAKEFLGGRDRIRLIDPLDYGAMANLMKHSHLVMTDSGGLQEEAPALGVPVLVFRDKTERPEAVAAGTVRLIGTCEETIIRESMRLLTSEAEYRRMAGAVNPYGDGRASERIAAGLLFHFDRAAEPPRPFEPGAK